MYWNQKKTKVWILPNLDNPVYLFIILHSIDTSRFYKLKYKSSEDGSKAEELIVPVVGGEGSLIATLKVLSKDYCFHHFSVLSMIRWIFYSGSDSWSCLQDQHQRLCRGHQQSRHWIKASSWENHCDRRREVEHISGGGGQGAETLTAKQWPIFGQTYEHRRSWAIPIKNWAIVAELITDKMIVCIHHDRMSGIESIYIW